jgi:hypothetical protein
MTNRKLLLTQKRVKVHREGDSPREVHVDRSERVSAPGVLVGSAYEIFGRDGGADDAIPPPPFLNSAQHVGHHHSATGVS